MTLFGAAECETETFLLLVERAGLLDDVAHAAGGEAWRGLGDNPRGLGV